MAVHFDSADIYINQGIDVRAKIARINNIITALEDSALKAAASGNVSEYSLDDGQTKIRTVYRNAEDVASAINAFETVRQRWINQLNGRQVRLVDSKNFNNGYSR